jgi:hypothetical protein
VLLSALVLAFLRAARARRELEARAALERDGYFMCADMDEVLGPGTFDALRAYCLRESHKWASYLSTHKSATHQNINASSTESCFGLDVLDSQVTLNRNRNGHGHVRNHLRQVHAAVGESS